MNGLAALLLIRRIALDTFCVLLWSVCLSGCVQPEAVKIDREAVRAEVKAAVLSPEVTATLSNHIETSIMPTLTARAEATITKNEETRQVQKTGTWGVNVGKIEGGATLTLALLAAWIIRWFTKKSGQAVKAVTRRRGRLPVHVNGER